MLPKITSKQTLDFWKRYFDFAEMRCVDSDRSKHFAIFRIEGFKKFHPAFYTYMRGYMTKLSEMAVKGKKVKVEQTKSLYNNDPYDEFKITWE